MPEPLTLTEKLMLEFMEGIISLNTALWCRQQYKITLIENVCKN